MDKSQNYILKMLHFSRFMSLAVLMLLTQFLCSCGEVGHQKLVGLGPFMGYHVNAECGLDTTDISTNLALTQLILRTDYIYEEIGPHTQKGSPRKSVNFMIPNERTIVADRDIVLGGKTFLAGESFSEMLHWQGSEDRFGFRIAGKTIQDSDLAKQATTFTCKVKTTDGLELQQSVQLQFDSTIVLPVLKSGEDPCK